ncbi:MAG: 3-deoxy-D-manno-octulosonic acid transferase [Flavobacteriales bacterium]|nr:3-deoxy-D-manno-octulosonic acid transferase [Flavobacteriales bacterium]MCC6577027.1 3-deoxy-D-manno-octulosonic acid transferase [Flavobacteriales bacterium]NUQ15589.1 3-deoxy-D-manno-octulosonic acid transferase [Flavobacteriales bacterium]
MAGAAHLVPACYTAMVRLAAGFHPKARAWVAGRRGLWERLAAKADRLQGCLWMHCASVGEFEQGLPVLEALRAEHPDRPVLVTFFSPSGYEARKHLPLATHVDYLPADSPANGARLVALLRPSMVLWVKYEFWPGTLGALHAAQVPTFLVSGIFRPGQPFFRWYGAAWRRMLRGFTHLFVQDEASRVLLAGVGIRAVTVSGDTRFDRVRAIVAGREGLPLAEAFRGSGPVLVCGSTWPADEALLQQALADVPGPVKCLVVPHELSAAGLETSEARFPEPLARWSELEHTPPANVGAMLGTAEGATLLVDRMGLLARLYRHGDVAYVGGGFGDGVHSLLEPAAWGLPVVFGPRHTKFAEAGGLIDAGGGFTVRNAAELQAVLRRLLKDPGARHTAGEAAARFVRERSGATARVVEGVRALAAGKS